MVAPSLPTWEVVSFGSFELVAHERLLRKDGVPVELGARALDILIALLANPNEVVSKKDLRSAGRPARSRGCKSLTMKE
jgi:DNA-binding winged helix-turn-helix (wHTH) protein